MRRVDFFDWVGFSLPLGVAADSFRIRVCVPNQRCLPVKILTNGYASVASIALIGLVYGLWTRQSHGEKPNRSAAVNSIPVGKLAASSVDPDSVFSRIGSSEEAAVETATSAERIAGIDRSRTTDASTRPASTNTAIDMLPGIAHPLQVAEISASADGPLWKMHVNEGDWVDSGKLLALIDNRIAIASVVAAQSSAEREAGLKSAEAKVALAEQYLHRIEQAASKKAASGLEIDEAKSRLAEAKAALQEGRETQREAEARLQIEQARLDSYEVRAPFDGTVVKIHRHLGETLSRDAVLVTLADTRRLRAEMHVPISMIQKIQSSDMISLVADLPEQPVVKAKVVYVAPLIDAATQTIRIVCEIENDNSKLPAGFAVRLQHINRADSPGS